jgi:poly-gamma-glutamate synthesis protein (capsule biosynthesis protein)
MNFFTLRSALSLPLVGSAKGWRNSFAQSLLVWALFTLFLLLVGCTPLIQQNVILRPVPPAAHFSTTVTTTETITGPVTVALMPTLPDSYAKPLLTFLLQIPFVVTSSGEHPLTVLDQPELASTQIGFERFDHQATPIIERYYAVVAPFATVRDDISINELQQRWQGFDGTPLFVTVDADAPLEALWGTTNNPILPVTELLSTLENTPDALGIMPFDQLDPRFKVLTIDGVNVLDNRLDPTTYPLAFAIQAKGMGASLLTELLRPVVTPITNRDATQLTTLMMTGVTAMSRGTAAAMARNGVLYPAAIISATLAAADITHISNEIPFLDDCVVNNTLNNLILCSHTDYWATLEAVGTDIVGLSGNHVNDFGREGARRSLQFYKDNNIPIYGSGLTIEEACAPLQWEHNGNSFAFFAFLAFGPESAWVTETEPGACYYYDRKEELLTAVREAAKTVDIVAVELQYEETYFPYPTANQVIEFRELREAGAAVVTGVQSHVPQAMEPYGANDAGGPGVIVYGLGNLFFDQMWSWETRTELYARHTIYGGRVISTEILTGVLEDFAQPRWATPEERAGILSSIFTAAPPRP